MKRILILGADKKQIQLIKAAKEEGYYVIVCDYTDNHPGIPLADKHYQISYLDKEAVLSIAKSEQIDGVIGNTDPAMTMVAYISEQLGLVGNSPQSIEQLLSKPAFRKLQVSAGLFSPTCIEAGDFSEVEPLLEDLKYPIIVKPSVCNGSQGTTKIAAKSLKANILEAFQLCKRLSRNQKVTIEEFVEMPTLEVVEGDIFVLGDEILWNGLFTTRRSMMAPMIPMTYIFPAIIPAEKLKEVKTSVTRLVKSAGIRHGEYNIEMYFTKANHLFVIEVNPRQGGHKLPQLMEMHSGIDFNKMLVTTAVGDNSYFNTIKSVNHRSEFITNHVIFTRHSGVLEDVVISPEIDRYVTDKEITKKGQYVLQCGSGTDFLAYVTLRFLDRDTQLKYSGENLERLIYPVIKNPETPISHCTLPYSLIYEFMTGDAYDFFVPKLQKVNRTVEGYAKQFSEYSTIAYEFDEEGKIGGMVAAYLQNLVNPGWPYIAEVYVNQNQRRKGLAEKLMLALINYCRQKNFKGVWLHVKEYNYPAQQLYKKLGFLYEEGYLENGSLKMYLEF